MAMAEVFIPSTNHQTGEQLRTIGGGMPQEGHGSEEQGGDGGQRRRFDVAADTGYNIPILASYDGGIRSDSNNAHTGMPAEGGESMYYTPCYEYTHQLAYCSQPQGPYMATGATGYSGPQYGPVYQQVSPAGVQYYPLQHTTKESSIQNSGQNAKSKPGGQDKVCQEMGYKMSVQWEAPNHCGVHPARSGFYGSASPYEYYSQQWHSSQRGFQPLSAPQNMGLNGNYAAPMMNGGPGRYQNFPRVGSGANVSSKGCNVKGGSGTISWRPKEVTKAQSKGGSYDIEACTEQTRQTSMGNPKVGNSVKACGEMIGQSFAMVDNRTSSVNRSDYNKEDFKTSYEAAKFFIIKSYSEDDVHKSIKYSVWSSTPNGNKRLDEAYKKGQESPDSLSMSCPIFFFFSVNCSGQFCGVAEMVGPVDFNKNMEFWLQGKWTGCFPLKWHIIKDIPNGHFRHIILSNNENKPVTHSRDTQEVHLHQGLEMLKIFKFFPTRTSLLDDFAFYDARQKILQERKMRQQLHQQVVKQIGKGGKVWDDSSDCCKENGRLVKRSEKASIEPDVKQAERASIELAVKQAEKASIGSELKQAKIMGTGSDVEQVGEVFEVCIASDNSSNLIIENRPEEAHKPEGVAELSGDTDAGIVQVSKICKEHNNRHKVDKDETCKPKVDDAAPAATSKHISSERETLPVSGSDKDSKLDCSGAETLGLSTRKNDTSRGAINYKKALLEGIAGKVIVPDQAVGA